MFPKKELAQLVISACNQYNVDTVVISPGSRNAPLTIGFSNHPNIKTLSVVDERCAAFFAMGIAQQNQKPVAVVCSSGSALLNYYPAIAEAFYSNIPLVIISADRPKHLIDIGDGQTIRQENVFENHILFSVNLVESKNQLKNNKKLLEEALQVAVFKKGPIHINVPFDEPLYDTVEELTTFNFDYVIANKVKQSISYDKLNSIWNSASKKIILIGANFPSEDLQSIITKFSDEETVLIMTETTSNINGDKIINSIDKLIAPLNEDQLNNLQPDLLITMGGMVVSKKIKQFLRKYSPEHHWHVDELTKLDTFFCLTEHVQEEPYHFLMNLLSCSDSCSLKGDYQSKWLQEKKIRDVKHESFLKIAPYSDLKAFEAILKFIPDNSQVQISNSSIIRYSQLFNLNSTLRVFCNRGTSGIDGSTSTAIGAAFASEKPTTFITGDLSFFYDSNALWNENTPKNFRIIILNNAGGGIFRFIPGPSTTNATNYFETPHSLTAEHLAKMYNFDYTSVSNLEELNIGLNDLYSVSNQPKILEIFTPKEINDVVLKNYFKNL
ncbi:2-succinyl-5-enolpyruvyl-6-hydroxy-3-cyclohexene-1-carboxylic-acid synthase [Tenacibaculum ovolyticum]|uniref:2-succinyl-5-enolpyruvyl-6-hydroxy-3- cyclohexene-1-carboxylic-acid synthase n=1 Tax=Tenacibaculum ovolyticum TaxID=104270 RepID=UPI0007ED27FF|nr:2-succinyl-5-enolpyruvyl-6-hydroxy-3-cyclohexene-1-carboxylic-acid synthase [Tenacibaculum ovolyticum]